MPPKHYGQFDFNLRRQQEHWNRIAQLSDLPEFSRFVDDDANPQHRLFGAYAMKKVKEFYAEVNKEVAPKAAKPGSFTIFLDQGAKMNFVSLSRLQENDVLVWSCFKSEQDERDNTVVLDGVGCLKKLATVATGARTDFRLQMLDQTDNAFMWKAPSVHPLQTLENAYQRVVLNAVKQPGVDARKAQSETLSRFFLQDAGASELFSYKPLPTDAGKPVAAVKMNHLIDTFYLFRLLVQYQIESPAAISDDLRMEASSSLTKLLHNGDRTKMGWVSEWLTKKIAQLGAEINTLNKPNKQRVIFFLKGGRALNYYLGTPEKGENDWDTQVVIDPRLPAEEWYECFNEVHDRLLPLLKAFKTEFTDLVQKNSASFAEYLKDKAGPAATEDEEIDENEASDINSLSEHASCKAELIDIGIPRRDSASALEEWTHLSAPGALLATRGVIYPHRDYYINEYMMMVRDAFVPNADVAKSPKRVTRFGLILESGAEEAPSALEKAALPQATSAIAALAAKGRRALFGAALSQFVEAYNLHQDRELAAHFDREFVATLANPPALSTALAAVLDNAQKAIAADVGVAHALSVRMDEHWARRNEFFDGQSGFFDTLVLDLARQTGDALRRVQSQFAIAGSYAARLHKRHLRSASGGLEPIRRILVKLQCPRGKDRAAVMGAVAKTITDAATATNKLTVAAGEKQSLLIYWTQKVTIGTFTYAPLVMKVRVAEQTGNLLPVLSSIDGLPVLDLRYVAADYLRKTSKIDEPGSRRVLASATAAVSEMLSTFEFDSDDGE